ncbi:MAG: hypothetical protein JSS60_00355 [Verrucomicrobia bacterium]|nr:hypothetical protein [Verrucomicrobiota bacterium]
MTQHQFLLTPSSWLGQGKIQLNMVSEELAFFTRWSVENVDGDGRIECTQEIQVKGLSDIMHNEFLIYNLASGEFAIDLENQALGRITGKGLVNDKVIAWEFRVEEIGFEGFELYEKQDDKNYLMRAEYATSDQFRTLIQGRVWQQTT